jgi:type VI protein secretion system component Hcp
MGVVAVIAVATAFTAGFIGRPSHVTVAGAQTERDGTMTITGFESAHPQTTIPFGDHEWSAANTAGGGSGGGGAGKVKFNDFIIHRQIDSFSPLFLGAVARGRHYSKVTVRVMEGQVVVFQYDLYDVVFTKVVESPDAFNALEDVSMSFGKIRYTNGPTKVCWDVKANIKC